MITPRWSLALALLPRRNSTRSRRDSRTSAPAASVSVSSLKMVDGCWVRGVGASNFKRDLSDVRSHDHCRVTDPSKRFSSAQRNSKQSKDSQADARRVRSFPSKSTGRIGQTAKLNFQARLGTSTGIPGQSKGSPISDLRPQASGLGVIWGRGRGMRHWRHGDRTEVTGPTRLGTTLMCAN